MAMPGPLVVAGECGVSDRGSVGVPPLVQKAPQLLFFLGGVELDQLGEAHAPCRLVPASGGIRRGMVQRSIRTWQVTHPKVGVRPAGFSALGFNDRH